MTPRVYIGSSSVHFLTEPYVSKGMILTLVHAVFASVL